jgi:hypothetical protein
MLAEAFGTGARIQVARDSDSCHIAGRVTTALGEGSAQVLASRVADA